MEEDHSDLSKFDSVYWDKKRKFQADQLGLLVSKHKCWDQSFRSESDFSSNKNTEAQDFLLCINKGKTVGRAIGDGSDPESVKYSNSSEDTESAENESNYAKTSSYDWSSTSSGDWGSSSSSRNSLYSWNSISVTKASDKEEPPYIVREHDSPCHDFGLQTSLSLDDRILELRNHVGCSCSEHKNDSIEQLGDKEPEDMLYSNGVNQSNFVLSSGRWSVNQGTQPGTKKMTIDKEFEQYFSTFMLD